MGNSKNRQPVVWTNRAIINSNAARFSAHSYTSVNNKTRVIRCICYDNNLSKIFKNINQDHSVGTLHPFEWSRWNFKQKSPCHPNEKAIQISSLYRQICRKL